MAFEFAFLKASTKAQSRGAGNVCETSLPFKDLLKHWSETFPDNTYFVGDLVFELSRVSVSWPPSFQATKHAAASARSQQRISGSMCPNTHRQVWRPPGLIPPSPRQRRGPMLTKGLQRHEAAVGLPSGDQLVKSLRKSMPTGPTCSSNARGISFRRAALGAGPSPNAAESACERRWASPVPGRT